MKLDTNESPATILRHKAEELLKMKLSRSYSSLSAIETEKLIHELEVHQIELELQNKELILTRSNLQELAEKYTELYDLAPSGYFTLSNGGKIIGLNLCGSQMLGKERSRLISSGFNLHVSKDTKPIFYHFLERVFTNKGKETCDVTLSTNGSKPICVHLTAIAAENGEECLVTAVDITERNLTEELLRINEERFRAIAKSAYDAIITTNSQGTILDWNKGADKIFGYTEKEITGKEMTVIIPQRYIEHHKNGIKRMEQGEEHHVIGKTVELQGLHKNGNEFPIELSLAEWETDAGKFYTGIIRDITERKKAEENLIVAKEHAEESDRLKSAFLANMSHEIRTPMNSILGFARLMKEPNLTGMEQQKFISIIEKSGKRMLNLINNIVDISKIESGQMEISISESNINEQIEYIYNFFKPEVETNGIQFFFKTPLPGKKAVIKTDREKIYGILTNLVKNAIKYTKEGSIEFGYDLAETLHVETLHATSVHATSLQMQFFVKDTGCGIPKDRQEAIFERFIQADISDKQAYQGAGLGLAISKAYVEMLGGKIWVDSEPGKGSIFYFTIPYNNEPQEQTILKNVVSEQYNDVQLSNLKILIAEDDEVSEMLISAVINKISDEVFFATTGIEAIEACRNNPGIDFVLMDIQMPDMNGYEATRQIRQFNKDVVIIAQTAFGLAGDREKAIEAGCNDYIAKPINTDELLRLMQRHFNK